MDKSWMYRAPRASSQYVSGVEYFLNFAFENSSKHGMILCPCTDCHNRFHLERDKVYDHLICVGFKRGYLNWTDHGESNEVSSSSMIENDEDEDMDHEMHEILHDLFPTVSMERSMGEQEREGGTERERERKSEQREFNRENQNDKKKFDDLVKDGDQKFLQEELLPHGNILPKKHHEVKNIMNKLRLGWRPNQEDNSGDKSGDEAGEYACPVCAFDKTSKWLNHSRKWCCMGYRRWLEPNHSSRKDTRSFDGHQELRQAPIVASGDDILNQLKGVDFLFENVEKSPWKKKSIFFTLPYWKNLLLRHNLDVMHIEKNICDNIVGTLLGQVGKSKDN
ncbi:transposon, En/Spm-like protein [Tanacetum coccineum]